MLLYGDSQLLFSLMVHLVFDDDTEKKAELNTGDYILLKVRRNGSKFNLAGKIVGIDPVMLNTHPDPKFTAHLIVDCARQFKSTRLRISVNDILNFKVVSRDDILDLYPDYIITDDMFKEPPTPTDADKLYNSGAIDFGGLDYMIVC